MPVVLLLTAMDTGRSLRKAWACSPESPGVSVLPNDAEYLLLAKGFGGEAVQVGGEKAFAG